MVAFAILPAVVDRHMPALDVSGFVQAPPQAGQAASVVRRRRRGGQPRERAVMSGMTPNPMGNSIRIDDERIKPAFSR